MKTSSSNELSLYFLHIEKSAGMSLNAYLDNFFPIGSICPARLWGEFSPISPDNVAQYRLFRGHFGYALANVLPQFPTIITVLRDPVERTLSHYQAIVNDFENWHVSPSLSIETFLSDREQFPQASNWQTRSIGHSTYVSTIRTNNYLPTRWTPAMEPMQNILPIEELYALAVEHLESFAVVGLTEKLDEALSLIAHQFGWFPTTGTPRTNVSRQRPLRENLAPAVLEQIVALNHYDQQLYDRAFELFERQYHRMMFDLLVEHYQNGKTEPPTDRLDFTFDQPILGNGWYAREINAAGTVFCWCGVQSTATLHFRLAGETDLKLRLTVAALLQMSQLETIRLKVNGEPLAVQIAAEGHEHFITAILPKAALQMSNRGYTQISIQVGQSLVPNEIGLGPDLRRLGIALNRVQIEPV